MNQTANSPSWKKRMRLPLYAAGGAVVGFSVSATLRKLPSDLNWTLSVYYDYDLLFALVALVVLVTLIWNIISLARTPSVRPEEDEADYTGNDSSLISPAERSLSSAMMVNTFSIISSFAWAALSLSLFASSRHLSQSPNLFTLGNLVVACIAVIIVVVMQSLTIKRYNRYRLVHKDFSLYEQAFLLCN
ncbi:DUF3169 family protein [Paenibacillus barcinonensis]|uniref:DUF3169 family protein n=1 Tax=Paenibacillus barcinonensis TaxID=198119 RepID=A0A2V4URE6_PAEBA|nr:DUF3169 family protein [Paenibacillus barcinonensis]PYE42663.1 uncharacterized protein DUF3169 [Paenibacillus barcinonensis]QKS58896.1 DUF3169 family protein [Paenibacillus barcinonensis]